MANHYNYLISGPSGAGKSTTGERLKALGYRVVETDFEPGLSSWINFESGQPATEVPPQPYPKSWRAAHRWLWDTATMSRLLASDTDEPIFFVGGTENQKNFYDSFDEHFILWVPTNVMVPRLQKREPQRWVDGSHELEIQKEWNEKVPEYARDIDAILIDSSKPTDVVVKELLEHTNGR